jgi:hypothetical protein
MGNLISIATHCQRGEEVILGSESHIYHYEQGGVSGAWRLTVRRLPIALTHTDGFLVLRVLCHESLRVAFVMVGVGCGLRAPMIPY